MAGCSICKHENKGKHDFPCCECVHNAREHFEHKTNADRIRAMSDEELVEFFSKLIKLTQEHEYCHNVEEWSKWLKLELKE